MGVRAKFGALCLFGSGLALAVPDAPKLPPFSVRDVSPPTAANVSQALRERIAVPERIDPPDRLFAIDMGLGLPALAAVQFSVQILRRWQIGASYGILPGSDGLFPVLQLPPLTYTLPDNNDYALNPVVSSSLQSSLCPFIRYFPTHRTTYLQLTWAMIQTHHRVVSGLHSVLLDADVPDSTVTADVTLTHTLPTLSIGHIFWRRLFFVNISIGATFVLSTSSSTKITTDIPDPLGAIVDGSPGAFDPYARQMDQSISSTVTSARDAIGIIPSIMLTTGLMF